MLGNELIKFLEDFKENIDKEVVRYKEMWGKSFYGFPPSYDYKNKKTYEGKSPNFSLLVKSQNILSKRF